MHEITHHVFLGQPSSLPGSVVGSIRGLDLHSVHSVQVWVYYCPTCGVAWGGRVPDRATQRPNGFWYTHRECAQHGGGSLVETFDYPETMTDRLAMYEISIFRSPML